MKQNNEHIAYSQFEKMHRGLGADYYKVQVRDPNGDTGGAVGRGLGFQEELSKEGKPIPLIPSEKVIYTILTTEKKVAGPEKWSPIIRPVSSTKTYILVDDLDDNKLQALKTAGFKPAYVQETSHGNFQVTLIVQKIQNRKIANAVATQIKMELGGDAACNGADHTMRIPGFENAKEKHKRPDGSYPVVTVIEASGELCPKATDIANHIIKNLHTHEQKVTDTGSAATIKERAARRPAADPHGEIWYVWQRLAEKHISKAIHGIWKSEQDWLIALALRHCGYSKEQVADALIQFSPRYDRGTSDESWAEKQEHTAQKAFSDFGTQQLAKYSKYHNSWKKDRDSALVIRNREMNKIAREKLIDRLREGCSEWDGKQTEAKVLFIDNDKAILQDGQKRYEVKHNIDYNIRPRINDIINLTKSQDGAIVLEVKNCDDNSEEVKHLLAGG